MKTILVTGSSRGIGKAVAKLASAMGYKVIVHGRTDSEELQKIHKEIKESVKTFFDVADKKATHDAISKLGHIDVLINNAGIGKTGIGDVAEIDDEDARIVFIESSYQNKYLAILLASWGVTELWLSHDDALQNSKNIY